MNNSKIILRIRTSRHIFSRNTTFFPDTWKPFSVCLFCYDILCKFTGILGSSLFMHELPWSGYELSCVRVVLGESRPAWVRFGLGTNCLGYEWSWLRVILGSSCLGYELSWVWVVHNSTQVFRCWRYCLRWYGVKICLEEKLSMYTMLCNEVQCSSTSCH